MSICDEIFVTNFYFLLVCLYDTLKGRIAKNIKKIFSKEDPLGLPKIGSSYKSWWFSQCIDVERVLRIEEMISGSEIFFL